ncbi:MAG: hypothetical protein ACJ786_11570 [Catenulispora sp.]
MTRGRRARFGMLGMVVGLATAMLGGACSHGSSKAAVVLDGRPRLANDEGVVTAVTKDRLTLDGKRTYSVDRNLQSFESTTLKVMPLLNRTGAYVQIGEDHGKVRWIASYTLVVTRPDQPPTAFHTGRVARTEAGRVVFADGSVLAVAPGVTVPEAGRQARAEIDVPTHRVRALVVTS